MIPDAFKEKNKVIRNDTFRKNYPQDLALNELVKGHSSHAFLMNPAGQRQYLYLIEYIKAIAEFQIGRPIDQIKMLDWGSGKGHVIYLLQKKGADITACEIESKVTDANFPHNVPIIQKNKIPVTSLFHPYKLPFADASFDVVISMGVLEHVPEQENSLGEISRILNKNGLFLCFFLPQKYSWTQKIEHMRSNFYHDRLYDLPTIRRLLAPTDLKLADSWQRALFPKNRASYPFHHFFEVLDQLLCDRTVLKHLATNIEFVAIKK